MLWLLVLKQNIIVNDHLLMFKYIYFKDENVCDYNQIISNISWDITYLLMILSFWIISNKKNHS